MHVFGAKAVCFGEALKPEFRTYQEQVVKNAKALSTALMEEGFHLVSNGTDNHLMLVDLQNMNITGKNFRIFWTMYILLSIKMQFQMIRPVHL